MPKKKNESHSREADPGRVYKWRRGSTFKVDPQVAGEYLEELKDENDGLLQPDTVWQAARDPSSPIHDEFEWDMEKAAARHWRQRARNLMNHVAVVATYEESADDGAPAFINVKVATKQRAYVNTAQVIANEDWHDQAVASCLKQLKGLQARYEKLTELDEVWAAIRKAEKKRKRAKVA